MRNSGRHITKSPWATSVFCLVRLWRRVRWVISGQHIRNETAEPGRAGGLAHLDKGRGVGVWGLPLSSVNNLEAGTLFALDPVLPIGVRLDQAGVDRKAVPTDQPLANAAPQHCFKQSPQEIALAEAAVAVLGEGRMIGHLTIKPKPTEPSIRQIEMDLFAKAPLRTDADAVADDQHSDHQFGINRRSTHRAVEGS